MLIDHSKLRNITARKIISALSRDGFYPNLKRGVIKDIITSLKHQSHPSGEKR